MKDLVLLVNVNRAGQEQVQAPRGRLVYEVNGNRDWQ